MDICSEILEEDIINDNSIKLFIDTNDEYHVVVEYVTSETKNRYVTRQSVESFKKYKDAYLHYRIIRTKL